MYGDIYPTKYTGKTTDTFDGSKSKIVLQIEPANNVQLLMLALGFVVNSRFNGISVESMECLNEGA